MKNQNKKPLNEVEKILQKKVKKGETDALKEWILSQTEALIENRFTDKNLDKAILKRFLLENNDSGQLFKYVQAAVKPYAPKFPLEFYRQIYRLRNLRTDGNRLYQRPGFIGRLTNQMIYARFPKGILEAIQELNPLANGIRPHKHFQRLTIVGEEELKIFIADAIATMQQSRYWNEFVRLFSKKYGATYQIDMFDE
jgi:hypothetical protein